MIRRLRDWWTGAPQREESRRILDLALQSGSPMVWAQEHPLDRDRLLITDYIKLVEACLALQERHLGN